MTENPEKSEALRRAEEAHKKANRERKDRRFIQVTAKQEAGEINIEALVNEVMEQAYAEPELAEGRELSETEMSVYASLKCAVLIDGLQGREIPETFFPELVNRLRAAQDIAETEEEIDMREVDIFVIKRIAEGVDRRGHVQIVENAVGEERVWKRHVWHDDHGDEQISFEGMWFVKLLGDLKKDKTNRIRVSCDVFDHVQAETVCEKLHMQKLGKWIKEQCDGISRGAPEEDYAALLVKIMQKFDETLEALVYLQDHHMTLAEIRAQHIAMDTDTGDVFLYNIGSISPATRDNISRGLESLVDAFNSVLALYEYSDDKYTAIGKKLRKQVRKGDIRDFQEVLREQIRALEQSLT